MSLNSVNPYDGLDARIAEFYDQYETQLDDVALLRSLLSEKRGFRILEPFCGTGRILVPLAQDGHDIVGLDQSLAMLERAKAKVAASPEPLRRRVALKHADVVGNQWPAAFDVVLLAANCLWELASAEEQEGCICSAVKALRPGGYLFLDNGHVEGQLPDEWCKPGKRRGPFPNGLCLDGARLEAGVDCIWSDQAARMIRSKRTIVLTHTDGRSEQKEWVQQLHAPSTDEMAVWVKKQGLLVEQLFGDRFGNVYSDSSPRAIFWARKSRAH